ncbi:7077_t:CDS:2, partial [Funneliformis geosporum]
MANPKKKDCKRVLAKWSCSSDGCPNKWTGSTLILIKKYKDKISAKDLKIGDYIEQKCKICDNKQNELTDYEPYFFEHLVYEDKEKKKWYRVFGEWDCNNNECEKKWTSSYTWILLEKYQNDIPASDLNRVELSSKNLIYLFFVKSAEITPLNASNMWVFKAPKIRYWFN